MLVKYLFLSIFALLFLYGLIRPFSSIFAKLFLIIGSIFGFLSLLGADYVNQIALFIGVENATLLYLYFGLVTIFLTIIITLNRFDEINSRITKLTRKIAILESKIK
ncbi:DUF2304 domain-containing protein [Gammaproteobacteria bacterium]|nr:DUF2304 domain-containing protein [Gammaproteobacteria bacterium]|tara:strand:- start:268 stop:588 length:321 start_codon:yes stop_codon:yes gene_type:complete